MTWRITTALLCKLPKQEEELSVYQYQYVSLYWCRVCVASVKKTANQAGRCQGTTDCVKIGNNNIIVPLQGNARGLTVHGVQNSKPPISGHSFKTLLEDSASLLLSIAVHYVIITVCIGRCTLYNHAYVKRCMESPGLGLEKCWTSL